MTALRDHGTERKTPPVLRRVSHPVNAVRARGEPMLWLSGGALSLALFMVFGLLALVFVQGMGTFWPSPLVEVKTTDGRTLLGEVTRDDEFAPEPQAIAALPESARAEAERRLAASGGTTHRRLLRTGNYELTGEHFHWITDLVVASEHRPEWGLVLERVEWGRFYGHPAAFLVDGVPVATEPATVMAKFDEQHGPARDRFHERRAITEHEIGALGAREDDARLAVRRAELEHGANSAEHRRAMQRAEEVQAECARERVALDARAAALSAENARYGLKLRTAAGEEKTLALADVVRLYAPNQLSLFGELGVYLDRWLEFLVDEPRETNTEGGVYPAIFGTVLMTLLMTIVVVPFGVLAALYIREYAKAGVVISAVRIAVNNLAGVPSIVFGVVGLGFFCYVVGGSIDAAFYAERLPNPTFGKGALLWAALTLALLTLPVVIVATEEALAAVPSSMREGSYACGASKWQTIRNIVLPRAMPGIMTGAILAMARGAGEVAPLMLVGAVNFAPELPLDGEAPFLHPSRSFMHLGLHIYDVGLQSQNSEASKPMVYTTTLLLIGVITILNVAAIRLRSRLRAKFAGAQF